MKIQPTSIVGAKLDERGQLSCPRNGNYLHQKWARIAWRKEDAMTAEAIETRPNSRKPLSLTVVNGPELPGRRDVMFIGFECETCPRADERLLVEHVLVIQQCKGCTDMYWLIDGIAAAIA